MVDDLGERGIAVYFIRAILVLVICGVFWYVGNLVLFSDQGIATVVENFDNNIGPITNTGPKLEWFWTYGFPFVMIVGVSVYVIYSALIREPRAWEY